MRAFSGRRHKSRTIAISKPIYFLIVVYFLILILVGLVFNYINKSANFELALSNSELKNVITTGFPITKLTSNLQSSEDDKYFLRKLSKFFMGFDLTLPKSVLACGMGTLRAYEEKIQPAFLSGNIDDKYEEYKIGNNNKEKIKENLPPNMLPIVDVNTWKTNISGYKTSNNIYMRNESNYNPDLDQLLKAALPMKVDDSGPQVLIVHTHTTEAYLENDDNSYKEGTEARSQDVSKSVARVGEEITKVLIDKGIKTIHDKTINDYPNYTGSYTRTLTTIESYKKKYPSIKIVIDVHRDSMVQSDGTNLRPIVEIDGKRTSQVMLVMGTDEGGLSHTKWKDNLNLAVKIQNKLNELYPKIARPINLRKERFNQHATQGSMIVEVGSSSNTLEQATNAGKCFATALASVLK